MSVEKIREASDVLEEASESVEGEAGEQLRSQAEALADLADWDRGPDHGRIARHQQKLKDLKGADSTATEAVDRANQLLNEYRETIEGV